MAIALYQAVAVPQAGVLTALWLSAGAVFYALHLAPRARVVDTPLTTGQRTRNANRDGPEWLRYRISYAFRG